MVREDEQWTMRVHAPQREVLGDLEQVFHPQQPAGAE